VLSRVADSLYWIARYMERAEDTSGLLHVNFHALLDTNVADHPEAWRQLIRITGQEALFAKHADVASARTVSEFLLWHPKNPDSVVANITRARENARGVREQVTTDMWQHLNRLYFSVRDVNKEAVLRAPHGFFARIRQSSHAFQGITKATMPHGEAYEFIELGTHLERAVQTARIVNIKHGVIAKSPPGGPAEAALLVALLKSCGAFEAIRKRESSQLQPQRVAEYLLLDRDFPRAVLFCLDTCLRAVTLISGDTGDPQRALGRLCAQLAFFDHRELHARPIHELLNPLIYNIEAAGEEITRTYFHSRVVALDAFAVLTAGQQQQ
jgi:uncharacterized alpha-E superfamily protein